MTSSLPSPWRRSCARLGLDYAASQLDAASGKAIARNDSPSRLLDALMREQLRVLSRGAGPRPLCAAPPSSLSPPSTPTTSTSPRPSTETSSCGPPRSTSSRTRPTSSSSAPSGVGKTHLANAIGQLACLRGYRVRFVVAADLVNDLVAAQATQHPPPTAEHLGRAATCSSSTSWATSASTPAAPTCSTRSSTGATSVPPPSSPPTCPSRTGASSSTTAAAASAIADRLVHKGLLIRITGKSSRSRQEVE